MMASDDSRRSRAQSYRDRDMTDLDSPISPISDATQLKNLFDFVKGELTSGIVLEEQLNCTSVDDLSAWTLEA